MHYRYIPESDPITVETYSSVACLPIPETGFQLAYGTNPRTCTTRLPGPDDSVLISSTFLVAIHVPELGDLDRTVIDSTFFACGFTSSWAGPPSELSSRAASQGFSGEKLYWESGSHDSADALHSSRIAAHIV